MVGIAISNLQLPEKCKGIDVIIGRTQQYNLASRHGDLPRFCDGSLELHDYLIDTN
jgi:hypothetical protein